MIKEPTCRSEIIGAIIKLFSDVVVADFRNFDTKSFDVPEETLLSRQRKKKNRPQNAEIFRKPSFGQKVNVLLVTAHRSGNINPLVLTEMVSKFKLFVTSRKAK